jgi:hypothetical protein
MLSLSIVFRLSLDDLFDKEERAKQVMESLVDFLDDDFFGDSEFKNCAKSSRANATMCGRRSTGGFQYPSCQLFGCFLIS